MIELYHESSNSCSRLITQRYSTSFSLGIKMFDRRFRQPIYNIYGFVRIADEIVDTFHDHDKRELMAQFRRDTEEAIARQISLNPVLHSFQRTVHEYKIESDLIHAFLDSMETDLDKTTFSREEYNTYIYGSAEVVGLMCLRIFVQGDASEYDRLRDSAKSLGAAFQKINFLRDIKSDYEDRGRVYFPGVDYFGFNCDEKKAIEQEIERDFAQGLAGIKQLPVGSRLGVYVAYIYYTNLLKRIKKHTAGEVREQRIRIPDYYKLLLLSYTALKYQVRLI